MHQLLILISFKTRCKDKCCALIDNTLIFNFHKNQRYLSTLVAHKKKSTCTRDDSVSKNFAKKIKLFLNTRNNLTNIKTDRIKSVVTIYDNKTYNCL